MRQTESAMRMLINAYKAVLTNCFNKEFVAGGAKRFVKGIALGSFLTAVLAGFSINSYAETVDIEDFRTTAENQDNSIIVSKDTTVEGIKEGIGGDETENTLANIKISVTEGTNFTVNNIVNTYYDIEGQGDISINVDAPDGDNKYITSGMYISGSIKGNSLRITNNYDDPEDQKGKGLYTDGDGKGFTIDVDKEFLIKSVEDGMLINSTGEDSYTKVTAGTITIENETRNGIYNASKNGMQLISESGDIIINSSGKKQEIDEAGIKNVADGTLLLTSASDIKVNAKENKNGIYLEKGNVVLNADGLVAIEGGDNGLFVNGGTITINSGTTETESLYNFVSKTNKVGTNIVMAGDYNGIYVDANEDSSVILSATENTYISGSQNGILSEVNGEVSSEINITSGYNNIIGFTDTITDDDGKTYTGVIGQTGINVSSGKVNLTARDYNIIKAKAIGIESKGINSSVSLDAGANIIAVDSDRLKEGAAILADEQGSVDINSSSGEVLININSNFNQSLGGYDLYGIKSTNHSNINIDSMDDLSISLNIDDKITSFSSKTTTGLDLEKGSASKLNVGGVFNLSSIINSEQDTTQGVVSNYALHATDNSEINIDAFGVDEYGNGAVIISKARTSASISSEDSQIAIKTHKGGLYVHNSAQDDSYGLYNEAVDIDSSLCVTSNADINVISENNSPKAMGETYGATKVVGLYSEANKNASSNTNISGKNVFIKTKSNGQNSVGNSAYGIYAKNTGKGQNNTVLNVNNLLINSSADGSSGYSYGMFLRNSSINITSLNNTEINADYAVYADNFYSNKVKQNVHIKSNNNIFNTNFYGVYSTKGAETIVEAQDNNKVTAGDFSLDYGTKYAIYALSSSKVTLNAQNINQLLGASYAAGNGTSVTLSGLDGAASKSNMIRSYAQISNAGGLSSDAGKVVSALYAEQGAKIELNGEVNDIGTYADNKDTSTLERTVWAYNGYASDYTGERVGSQISIKGDVQIKTDRYVISPDSLDVAIAAGTGVNLDKDQVSKYITDDERAKVNIDYSNISAGWLTDENSNDNTSYNIEGDILSAYEGLINIETDDAEAGINIHGNLLAGNNGILNVNLGKNGVLTGRADDYGDAGYVDEGHSTYETFADPAFSSNIYKGGVVNLKMGEGSRWNVTGQSWITTIETSDAAISDATPVIDLITANSDRDTNAHALTVYKLDGNAVFNMSLDGNRDFSDMLYIKNAQGEYTVNVKDAVSVADMYTNNHTGLRFATLGVDSNANFRAITWDGGVNNIEYEVATDDYDTSTENEAYNGKSLSDDKPGNTTVNTFFDSDGEPGSTIPDESGDEITETQSLAANVNVATVAAENAGIDTAASDTLNTNATNYKLVSVKSSEISDGGKTVIDMSRANYANAVYMDTLNKRQGEARFVGDTDHGVWVRLRHDNIGKDDSFRTHNTMVEVGIEQRDVNDYGEFHTGVALDYMNGQIDYHTVDGDGDIERYGVWFYTTYLGNDGQYADLVLKYGHLKNDFGFNTKTQGEHVTGDYTNEVASISAEYGWKFSNSYNYYIEPQAQLQYSYVTGADYTTSQGSKVELDSIHSLIGRIGFRAGKDFNTETPITAYIRGDVLHEFLGDQDIYAYDNTGVMDVTYKNDDTWYSAGVGLSVQSSENTYFFIEGEQVFGANNDSTYTVSGGFKHSF